MAAAATPCRSTCPAEAHLLAAIAGRRIHRAIAQENEGLRTAATADAGSASTIRVADRARRKLSVPRIELGSEDLARIERLVDLEPVAEAVRDAVFRLPAGQAEATSSSPPAESQRLEGST
ncbi:MAG: hypothetical protein OES24_15255 [Acidimicrobiia bacterium]|nr:hypothetical protein [Acidimicrobiia bacterium]